MKAVILKTSNETGNEKYGAEKEENFEGDIFNNARFRVPDSEFVNFNATYEPDNADWTINLWARNVLDKRHQTSRQRTSNLQAGNPFVTFSQGMRVGLDFGYNF